MTNTKKKILIMCAVMIVISASFVFSTLAYFTDTSSFKYSNSMSKLPDLMMLFALVTESVNHANVVPTNIAEQTTRDIKLVNKERRSDVVFFFFSIVNFS